MPLLKIIAAAAALAAAALGIKKGLNAKDKSDKAKEMRKDTQEMYDSAWTSFEYAQKKYRNSAHSLGQQKKRLYTDALLPFARAFEIINNVDYGNEHIEPYDMEKMKSFAEEVVGVVGSNVDAIDRLGIFGVLLGGFSSPLGVSRFGPGVSASALKIAWDLLMRVYELESQAEDKLKDARSDQMNVQEGVDKMREREHTCIRLYKKADRAHKVLKQLQAGLEGDLSDLSDLVSVNADYGTYTRPQKDLIRRSYLLAIRADELARAPIEETDDSETKSFGEAIQEAEELLRERGRQR